MPHPMKQIPPLHPDYSAVGIAAYVAELEWENRKLKEELEEVRELLKEEMMHAADLRVRLEVDVHSGSNWYEAK